MSPSASGSTAAGQPNRLSQEKSPYLLQHALNPVQWYPWGEDAFAKARAEDKPIFLSIGYSTCHWCHVMERESFENPRIAELLNRSFVSIKVDREELPDVDQVYMTAVTMMTGQGGWPLTVFLTPEGRPFFGGTYFPPERRWHLAGLDEVLQRVADLWRQKRQEILTSAEQMTATLQQQLSQTAAAAPGAAGDALSAQVLERAFGIAKDGFDAAHGGFGAAPKFPRSHDLSWLLTYWHRTRTQQALDMVTTTLDHLARGGIHDQVGGGFHRYSTDERWLVPHFEKMLYDQALLARTYLEAYRIAKRPDDAKTARDIFDYVLRDLRDAQGGFYTAEDADSEGEEGKFYTWTPAELTAVLGRQDAELVMRFYGVTPQGHVEHQRSILHIEQPLEAFATSTKETPPALAQRLAQARAKLLAAREERIRPHRDDKVLTSWNGLMIGSLADGASTLDEPRYLEAAERAARFILQTLRRDGRLLRRWRDGEARYDGTLEDYAFFAYGLVALYEASYDPAYLAEAKGLAEQMVERFWDEAGGGFFLRAADADPLIVRSKDLYDGATPSGNSIAALVLLRIGRLTADARLETLGRRTLEAFGQPMAQMPFGYTQMLIALDAALGPTQEIVVAGDHADAQTQALLRVLHERFLPRAVSVLHPMGPDRGVIERLAPYVAAQGPVEGRPAAYVCEGSSCRLPVTDPAQLAQQLDAAPTQ